MKSKINESENPNQKGLEAKKLKIFVLLALPSLLWIAFFFIFFLNPNWFQRYIQ